MSGLEECPVPPVVLSLPSSGRTCLVVSPSACEETGRLVINPMPLRRQLPTYQELSATSLCWKHEMPMCMCSPLMARHQACKVYRRANINSGVLSTCIPEEKVVHHRKSTSNSSPALKRRR